MLKGSRDSKGEREGEVVWCVCGAVITAGVLTSGAMTLKGVNADWAKAHQCADVGTHTLQKAQTGFTADTGILS